MSSDTGARARPLSPPASVWACGLLGLLFPVAWVLMGQGFHDVPWFGLVCNGVLSYGLLVRSRIAWLLAIPWTPWGIFDYSGFFNGAPQPYLAIVFAVAGVRLLLLVWPSTLRFVWRRRT